MTTEQGIFTRTLCPLIAVVLCGALTTVACGEVDHPGSATLAHFSVPREGMETEFSTLPWPNDIRLDPDGTVNLRGFPADSPIVEKYLEVIDASVVGWGISAGIFFRFDGPLDQSTLPATAADSLTGAATAYLVDIDPFSPDYGRRQPVQVRFRQEAGNFIGPNHLVLLPVAGYALRPKTTYAALLTRNIRDARGRPLRRDMDLVKVLSGTPQEDPVLSAAWEAYGPLRRYLADKGIATSSLVNAAVFTTQAILDDMLALREAVYRDMPAPDPMPEDLAHTASASDFHVYEGTLEAPIYQAGEAPYSRDGGGLVFDDHGRPVLQRTERVRFALSVPRGPMPAAGWPVVLYAHGTGGSFRTHINGREAGDLARIEDGQELLGSAAVIGIDQVHHGTRCGDSTCVPEISFFNFQNPVAGRDNVRQGALDNVQLLRLVEAMDVPLGPSTGEPLRFDPQRILFMGHSQGGLTGPPFLAVEPRVPLAVLSGAGGNMILSLLQKENPVSIPQLLELILNETDGMDEFHPVLSLIQLFIEPADPVSYGRYLIREPPPGVIPKHIYLSQGLIDSYTPPDTTEALAVAAGLDLVEPWLEPTHRLALRLLMDAPSPADVDPEILAGFAPLARPLAGNLLEGTVTGVMLQYHAWGTTDGHFVIYYNPEAKRDYRLFVGSFLSTGLPSVTSSP